MDVSISDKIRVFLHAQVKEILASSKTDDEFTLAINNFTDDLAIQIGAMVGAASSHPIQTFGRFVLHMATAHSLALDGRRSGADEPDDAEATAAVH